jgi:hypothetical protein
VIWLCDLRGFTGLSETLSQDALIDLLNCYFGPMCKQLRRSLLLSSDFAATSGVTVESLGAFALKGVGAGQKIFAPRP